MHHAVDFRRIRRRARQRALRRDCVHQHAQRLADAPAQPSRADSLLRLHQPRAPLLAQRCGDGIGKRVRARARDRRIGEAADAVELGLLQEREQLGELGLGLAGKARDEGAADRDLGTDGAPGPDALEVVLAARRALHQPQDAPVRVLERHVEVGKDLPLRHERDHVVHVRVRIDVVQPHPHALARAPQLAERGDQIAHARPDRPAAPEIGAVAKVHAVGAGVLRYHQQLLHPGLHEALGLAHHLARGPGDERPAHRGNDAEAAVVVAAFGDLQVGVVARRELDPLRRNEVGERIVRPRELRMHRAHHLLERVRAGHREHARMGAGDDVALGAEAAGHDDAAVLLQRLADRIEGLLHRGVDEAAGVDHDQVRALIGRRDRVALGAKPGEDALGIDQGLRAAERDESDLGRFLPPHVAVQRFFSSSGTASSLGAAASFWGAAASFCGAGGKPANGNPVNMLRVWLCNCSCICMNMLRLWSM